MGSYSANWEDEENNRQVAFSVAYAVENDQIKLGQITPSRVSFLCHQTGTVKRTIGIHTDSGRALLAEQLHRAGRLQELPTEIQRQLFATVA